MFLQGNQRQMKICWYLGDTAFTYLVRGNEKCTWNSVNPILAGAITSIKRVEGGGWRKLLAVRFIDRKQARCDKNLKLRASKFTFLNHQIGSYKFTGFFNRLSTQQSLPVQYMYIMPSHVEAHILCMTLVVCLNVYVWTCLLLCCAFGITSPCYLLHVCLYISVSVCVFFFLWLCERVHSFMRVWPCSQLPVAFSPDGREGGKWPLICPAFSPSPY